ncbi:hypothetical protein JCM3774_002092 [Rhodotorula dairenensis]
MEQHDEARERFRNLTASTTRAVAAAKRPRSSQIADSPQPAPLLLDIRNDVVVHANSLAKEVTALALALKPPITVDAVIAEVDKLGGIIAKLAYVVELLPAAGALAKRASWYILDLLEAFQQFLPYAASALDSGTAGSRNDILRAAKTIWTVVDRAGALPETELEAERQSWRDAISMLDDCLDELKDFEETVDIDETSEAGADEAHTGAGAARGRSAQLQGKGGDVPATSQSTPTPSKERQRISATRHLLRLGRLLVHRLVAKSVSAPTTFGDPALLGAVRRPVSRLCALGDEIALELEPPQDGLPDVVDELCRVEDDLANELERVVAGLGSSDLQTSEAEWLQTWRKQRSGARSKLDAI